MLVDKIVGNISAFQIHVPFIRSHYDPPSFEFIFFCCFVICGSVFLTETLAYSPGIVAGNEFIRLTVDFGVHSNITQSRASKKPDSAPLLAGHYRRYVSGGTGVEKAMELEKPNQMRANSCSGAL